MQQDLTSHIFRVLAVIFLHALAAGSKELPLCIGDSVCGFVQSNVAGVTAVSVCRCDQEQPGMEGRACDLTWDPSEEAQQHGANGWKRGAATGAFAEAAHHSAVREQYKFCNGSRVLPTCVSSTQVSYTSYEYHHHATAPLLGALSSASDSRTVAVKETAWCRCPPGSAYSRGNYRVRRPAPTLTLVVTSYTCKPLPECRSGSAIQEVSQIPAESSPASPSSSSSPTSSSSSSGSAGGELNEGGGGGAGERRDKLLVSQKCVCPAGKRCPVKSITTRSVWRGVIYQFLCDVRD